MVEQKVIDRFIDFNLKSIKFDKVLEDDADYSSIEDLGDELSKIEKELFIYLNKDHVLYVLYNYLADAIELEAFESARNIHTAINEYSEGKITIEDMKDIYNGELYYDANYRIDNSDYYEFIYSVIHQ